MIRSDVMTTVADHLRRIVGSDGVLSTHSDLIVYECDGFVIDKNSPDVVVFPHSTDQVASIVKVCADAGVPFLPRGAGTSLAGGCLPIGGGVMIVLTRMKEILEINLLLTEKTTGGEFAVDKQVENGTDTRCRGDLDRAPIFIMQSLVINLSGVGDLDELIILPARDGAECDDHILEGNRQCML